MNISLLQTDTIPFYVNTYGQPIDVLSTKQSYNVSSARVTSAESFRTITAIVSSYREDQIDGIDTFATDLQLVTSAVEIDDNEPIRVDGLVYDIKRIERVVVRGECIALIIKIRRV